jgi:hypothetical protein
MTLSASALRMVAIRGEENMFLRNALGLAAIAALTACSSFEVVQPKYGAIVTLPANTNVVINGNPSLSGVRVQVDGTDYSNQLMSVSAARSEGDLNLLAGYHSIEVEADVPCWYCSGQSFHHTAQRKICVVPPGPLLVPSKTPRDNAPGNLSWATASEEKVVLATDAGTPRTRWNFRRLGGIASSSGLVESIEFPCRCLRSMVDTQGAPVGLAMCDTSDPLQQWQALNVLAFPPGNFRFQNNGRGVSDACLTEGPAPDKLLIQRACNDTPDQVWSITDNTTGQSGGSPF